MARFSRAPPLFACGRPNHATAASLRPRGHIGVGPSWAGLPNWVRSVSVQGRWEHGRDIQQTPLKAGECACTHTDCALSMPRASEDRRKKLVKGSKARMEVGQPSSLGRFPTLVSQVSTGIVAVHTKLLY